MKFPINYRGKKIRIDAKKVSFISRIFGLMFKSRKTENLIFEFSKDVNIKITSLFVFFDFLIVWLDEKNKVLDYKIVRPFTFSVNHGKKYRKFLEVPINDKNVRIIEFFVGKHGKV